jgi:hypothetical protein
VEASPEILALYRAWYDAPLGQRSGPLYDLVTTLGRYRGTWFDVGDQVMWLRKNDTIGVAPKLVPLPQPEEAEE